MCTVTKSVHFLPYLTISFHTSQSSYYVSCHIVPHLYLAISFHVSPYLTESLHAFHLSISCHISPYLIGDIGSYRILSYLTNFTSMFPHLKYHVLPCLRRSYSILPYRTEPYHIFPYFTLHVFSRLFIFSVSCDIFHLSMSYHILPYILLSAIHLQRHFSCFQITCDGM